MMTRRAAKTVVWMMMMGASGAMQASTAAAVQVPVRAMFAHEKIVHFGVTNSTSTPLTLKCGENVMRVDPGKTAQVKLPVGSKVTFVEANGVHAAGELLAEASGLLNGTTITVR